MENHQQILSSADFGNWNKGRKILIQEPLKRIPKPPQSYVEMKTLTHGLNTEEKTEALKGFYKNREGWKKEIAVYILKLLSLRDHNITNLLEWNEFPFQGTGYSPIEKIEMREFDEKKHGRSKWMLLVDFDFFREDGELRIQKIYISIKTCVKG